MRNLSIWVAICLLLSGCYISRQSVMLGKPETISVDSLNIDSLKAANKGYDAVYLTHYRTYEHYLTPNWAYSIVARNAYVILNTTSDYDRFSLTVPRGCVLKGLYARVSYPGGEIKDLKFEEFTKEKDSNGTVTYKYAYPNLTPGTLIQEGFNITFSGDIEPYERLPLSYSVPVKHIKCDFIFPDTWEINIRKTDAVPTKKIKRTEDAKAGKIRLTYENHDMPGFRGEAYAPTAREMGYFVDLMITKIVLANANGYISHKFDSDWNGVYDEFGRYVSREGGLFDSSVEKLTREITANCGSEFEKADSIVSYLQRTIEVDPGSEFKSYAKILEEKKADPFRLTGLTRFMLQKAGISAEFALCHSVDEGPVDKTYYHWQMFQYPAVILSIDKQLHAVYPYLKFMNLNKVPSDFSGQPAIIIKPSSGDFWGNKSAGFEQTNDNFLLHKTVNGQIITLPEDRSTFESIDEYYDIAIDEAGIVVVSERKVFSEETAYSLREELVELDKEEKDKFFREWLTFYDARIEVLETGIENLKNYRKPLILTLKYRIDNLVTVLPDEILFQTNGLLSPASSKKYRVVLEERRNPIRIPFDEKYMKHITVSYPRGWSLQSMPKNVEKSNPFGTISTLFTNNGTTLTIEQSRYLKKSFHPKEDYKTLIDLAGENVTADYQTLIFDVKPM